MDHIRTHFNHLLLRAERTASSFVMAINGAFFTIRSAGYTPKPSEIEEAKLNVSNARYLFVDGINDIFDEVRGHAAEAGFEHEWHINLMHKHLMSVSNDLTHQANRAITFGHPNRAAAILGNNVHGAQGMLLQQKLRKLDLSVQDATGQRWNDPVGVVVATVRSAATFMLHTEGANVST